MSAQAYGFGAPKQTGDIRKPYSRFAHGDEKSLWKKHCRQFMEAGFLTVGILQQEIVVSNDLEGGE